MPQLSCCCHLLLLRLDLPAETDDGQSPGEYLMGEYPVEEVEVVGVEVREEVELTEQQGAGQWAESAAGGWLRIGCCC